MVKKTTEKITGQIINLTKEDIKTLKTHLTDRENLHALITHCASKLKSIESGMWRTVYDLYPELIGYDLNINWVEKTIKVRYELTEWEKQLRAENK